MMKSTDLTDLTRVGRDLLQCQGVDDLRKNTLDMFEKVFRAEKSNFFLVGEGAKHLDVKLVISKNVEDRFLSVYDDYYYRIDPFGRSTLSIDTPVLLNEEVTPTKELIRTEYYNDFLARQRIHHHLLIEIKGGTRLIGVIALFRSREQQPFSNEDKRKVKIMLPYITSALHRATVIEQKDELQSIILALGTELSDKGFMVFDEEMHQVYVSESARWMVTDGSDASLDGIPAPLERKLRDSCRELEHAAKDGTTAPESELMLTLQNRETVSFRLKFARYGKGKHLFLLSAKPEKPRPYVWQALVAAGLTRREIEVISLVCEGLSNSKIGERLYISEYTVENHLKAIYEKTGIRGRTCLIHHVISLLVPDFSLKLQ
jgi:DNA-binding CsgD family transcriptional regulator